MKRHVYSNESRGGFTLVELLVVVGIVTILIALLLPALSKARQQVNNVSCMNRLRQMGLAIESYTLANRGSLPYGLCPFWYMNNSANGADPLYGDWSYLLTATMQGGSGYESDAAFASQTLGFRSSFFSDADTLSTTVPPALQYLCHPRLMPAIHCGNTAASSASVDFYLMSLPGGSTPPLPQYPVYKLGRVDNASSTILLMDGTQDFTGSGNSDAVAKAIDNAMIQSGSGYLLSGLTNQYTITHFDPGTNQDCFANNFQASNMRFRHLNNTAGNFLFADLHVQTMRYYSQTKCEVGLQNFLVGFP